MNVNNRGNKRAQTWSVDLVLGVVIFLLIIIIVYSLIASRPGKENQLRDDADRIYIKLNANENTNSTTGESLGDVPKVLEGNAISQEELNKLYAKDYLELKKELGISGNSEFCIVIVTDNNALIPSQNGSYSIGNGEDIILGGSLYCGD